MAEIFAVLIATILGLILAFKWKKSNWIYKVGLFISIIAAVLIAYNGYEQKQKEALIEKINARFGDIDDFHGATIPMIQIGNNKLGATFSLGHTGTFRVSTSEPILKIYIKNGKLFVWTIIHDKNGKVIAVIDSNTWTMFSDDYEYNDDKTAFELVTKGERKVYFQIELRDGIAHLSGYLLDDHGLGLLFYAKQNEKGGYIHPFRSELDYNFIVDFTIVPLFKYPRGKYYSQRVN